MKTLSSFILLLTLSLWPVVVHSGQTTSTLKFRPTQAQKKFPRVRAARQKRTEDIRHLFAKAKLNYPPAQVLLRSFKREGILELWVRAHRQQKFVHLKNYQVCAKSGVLGPKRKRGDLQVPEGYYQITWFNPNSNFLLSMKVNYPNPSDRARALARDPGGDIFIHGSCVTIGCLPLTDRWIEELYLIALDSHWRHGNRPLVHVLPTRLDEQGMAWLQKEAGAKPKLQAFWQELRPGYLYFEKNHMPARFSIGKDFAYRFQTQEIN